MQIPVSLIERAEAEISPEKMAAAKKRIAENDVQTLDGAEHVEKRREMIAAVAMEPVIDAFERYIGKNDLLPINYLMIGYLQSRAVGCIRYHDRRARQNAVATGFLVSSDLLVTNHHVFPVDDLAQFQQLVEDPVVEFNHEFDVDGRRAEAVIFELDPARFFHSHAPLDLAIVAVKPTDRSGRHQLERQGYLVLNGAVGKAGQGDFATIIQHPEGREKQIAIRKNEILDVSLESSITYESDTERGASGAAVFNDQWQVIALHSAGVAKKNDAQQYVDENGQVIEPVNGKIDADRLVWTSNRGIRVSSIMKHLEHAPAVGAHPLVRALFSPAYTDGRPFAFLSRPSLEPELGAPKALAAPPPPAPPQAPPDINISINISGRGVNVSTGPGGAPRLQPSEDFAFEKKFEDEMDFSDCAGFDEDFMGESLPMPLPSAKLRKKLAKLIDSPSSYTLRYHHFSSIHHAVRRVPVVTGANVHRAYRYAELDEEGSRRDKWYRDNRIDYDVQLDDAFYAKSGFDRGHLTRREDAEWGRTVDKAKLAADMTCSYANAVPQVPALNRDRFGYRGEWGKLEMELLERGIELETGKRGRICVFAGPLFDEDDPVFKGVQVALSFFKVVCWYDGGGQLRTTCYVLSQAELVDQIEFEALRFDQVFKHRQVPLDEIEAKTGLTFHQNIKKARHLRGE